MNNAELIEILGICSIKIPHHESFEKENRRTLISAMLMHHESGLKN